MLYTENDTALAYYIFNNHKLVAVVVVVTNANSPAHAANYTYSYS